MRSIEFIITEDGMIYAMFKEDGNIVNLRFVGINHDSSQTIKNWICAGRIPAVARSKAVLNNQGGV